MDKQWSIDRIIGAKIKIGLLVMFVIGLAHNQAFGQLYSGQHGKVKLRGDAPQEIITATSSSLVGKIEIASKKFNFKQPLNSFSFSQGDLQKKHAEESYWEVKQFPYATFSGEILSDFNLEKNGVYNVTVRGRFSMHGVDKEMKAAAVITVQDAAITVTSKFTIYLSDYNIKIPRLVSLKVSQEFSVDLSLKMNAVNL